MSYDDVKDTFVLDKVTFDGKEINLDKDIYVDKKEKSSDIQKKCGYTLQGTYYLKSKFYIGHKSHKDITLEYTTKVPKNDITHICRMSYPCKSFTYSFNMKDNDYKVSPFAFGFIDDGNKSPNRSDDFTSVNIKFSNWIFPHDGVTVVISKNN